MLEKEFLSRREATSTPNTLDSTASGAITSENSPAAEKRCGNGEGTCAVSGSWIKAPFMHRYRPL